MNKFLLSLALLLPTAAAAQSTFEVNGIVYTEDLSDPSKMAVIVVAKKSPMLMEGMSAYEGDIVIPSTIEHDLDTYQVTGIAQGAFMGSEVESLVINEGPNKILIGTINCPKLETLTLPQSIVSVDGLYAPELEELNWGDNIKSITNGSFIASKKLESLTLPAALKTVKASFYNLDGISSLKFDDKIKSIEQSFNVLENLKSLNFPASLRTLKMSFTSISAVESIEFADGIQKIESSCTGCKSLKSLKLPSTLTSMSYSFAGGNLDELVIPDAVTTIDNCFLGTFVKTIRFGKGFSDIASLDHFLSTASKIYCPWSVPPGIARCLKYGEDVTVYVPRDAVSAYEEAWNLAEINKRKHHLTIEPFDF